MEPSFRPLDDPSNRIDAIEEPMRRKLAAIVIGAFLLLALAAWALTPSTLPGGLDPMECTSIASFGEASPRPAIWTSLVRKPWISSKRRNGGQRRRNSATMPSATSGIVHYAERPARRIVSGSRNQRCLVAQARYRPLLIGVSDPQAFLAQARAAWPAKP